MSDFMDYYDGELYQDQNWEFKPNGNKKKKGFLYILSIVFFVFGFLISCLNELVYFIRKSQFNEPNIVGHVLIMVIVSLIIIVGLFLLSTRVFKKKIVLLIFSTLYLLGSLLLIAITFQNIYKENKLNDAAQDKLISICNDISIGKDVTEETFDKSEYGILTPVLYLVKDYGTKFKEFSTNMSNGISSTSEGSILSLDTLSNKKKINDEKKKVNDFIKLYDKYESDYCDLMINFETSVSSLEIPDSFKDSFVDEFRKSQTENRNNMSNYFKIERKILSKINNIMDLMISAEGKYTIQDNKILFKYDTYLNKYNEYMNDMQKLLEQESDIHKTLNEKLNLWLDKVNKIE